MRKNNKGFAISTVIYGLSIMGILIVAILMATMSTNRSNTRNLAQSIEEELNRISRTEVSFGFMLEDDDDVKNLPVGQVYTVPEGQSGFYRIELWGTQGGGHFDDSGNHVDGGRGAYTSGIVYLQEGQNLYFYVGRQQSTGSGRATEVRLSPGGYNEKSSYTTTIMAAAGGGNEPTAYGGTLYGYNSAMYPLGGAINSEATTRDYGILASDTATNKTLIGLPSGYAKSAVFADNGRFSDSSSPSGTSNGGDGYYPSHQVGTGGTSYISGYGGVSSYIANGGRQTTKLDKASFIDPNTGSPVYFVDGHMYPGVNTKDGKAKIERLSVGNNYNKLKRNAVLKGQVRYVRDCFADVTENTNNIFAAKISIMSAGKDLGGYVGYSAVSGSKRCAQIDLGGPTNVDEIAVWHVKKKAGQSTLAYDDSTIPPTDLYSGVDIINHTIEAGATTSSYQYLKGPISGSTISTTETVDGTRVSAYQNNDTSASSVLPNGDYYIMPVTAYGQVLTAPESTGTITDPVCITPLMGYKRQIWSIQQITNRDITPASKVPEYKITEEARYKAMNITTGENLDRSMIRADKPFNNYARDEAQIWKIVPAGDGTYFIRTVAPNPLHSSTGNITNTGNTVVQTNSSIANNRGKLMIGINNPSTERYWLISIDYLGGS